MEDTIKIVSDTLTIQLSNNEIPIKIIESTSKSFFEEEPTKTIITIGGTLLCVLFGFLLNYLNDNQNRNRKNYQNFISILIDYSNGLDNYKELQYAYNQLSKRSRKKYSEILILQTLHPTEKLEIINKLLQK